MFCIQKGRNTTVTILSDIYFCTVVLLTRVLHETVPAFSGLPNDWLSPTELFQTHTVLVKCGVRPRSLFIALRLTSVFTTHRHCAISNYVSTRSIIPNLMFLSSYGYSGTAALLFSSVVSVLEEAEALPKYKSMPSFLSTCG